MNMRLSAAEALWRVTGDGRVPSDLIAAILKDPEARASRPAALRLAGELGPAGKPLLPMLHDLTASGELGQRMEAAEALWKISHEAPMVLPVVREALGQRGAYPGSWAAKLMAQMGPEAKPALPELARAVRDRLLFIGVHEEAAKTLALLDPSAAEVALKAWESPAAAKK